jgi:hypothetical protein
MLFALYPGFVSQSISYVYSNYFLILAILFSSWRWMILAVRDPDRRKLHWVLALMGSFISTFTLEFFLGLELLRPVIIFIVTEEEQGPSRSDRIRRTLRSWMPFGVMFIVYLGWRTLVVGFKAYKPVLLDQLFTEPLSELFSLIGIIVVDWFEAVVLAWVRVFNLPQPSHFGSLSTLLFWVLVLISIGIAGLYLWVKNTQSEPKVPHSFDRWRRQAIILSLLCLGLAGWPHWIAGLSMDIGFPLDRFTLGFMFASCLLIVVLIESLRRYWIASSALMLLIIGLAVGWQFQTTNQYRRAWDAQARFMWQLAWRVPGLEPGTVILANEIPLDYMTDNSLTGAINWMYAPEGEGQTMPYMLYDISKRLGLGLPGLSPNLEIEQRFRTLTFFGTTSQAIVLVYNPTGCLRVLDPQLDDSSPSVPPILMSAIHLSQLSLITIDPERPVVPPEPLVALKPEGDWCYYFETADLARQTGDWARIVELGDIAFSLDQNPDHAEERIPFIEAYAHMGQWDRALELTFESYEHNPSVRLTLCHAWDRLQSMVAATHASNQAIATAQAELGCDV